MSDPTQARAAALADELNVYVTDRYSPRNGTTRGGTTMSDEASTAAEAAAIQKQIVEFESEIAGRDLSQDPGRATTENATPHPSTGPFSFGYALALLKDAHPGAVRVQRVGWNGKGMHIMIERRDGFDPCIVMLTAAGTLQPGWLASQADMLAEDWQIAP